MDERARGNFQGSGQSASQGSNAQSFGSGEVPPRSSRTRGQAAKGAKLSRESVDDITDSSRNWAARVGQGPTRVETVAEKDALAREGITAALVSLLRNRFSTEPLTIGLFGAWGSGKSSQVGFVKKRLEKAVEGRPHITVIEFNAWEHEKVDNLSAALAQTVVEQLIRDSSLLEQWKLARQLAARKRAHITRAAEKDSISLQARLYQWVAPFMSLEVALALVIVLVLLQANWEWPAKLGASAGVFLLSAWKAVEKYVSGNLSNWFKRIAGGAGGGVFGLPDFAAKLGSFHEIRQTLQHLVSLKVGDEKDAAKGEYLLIVVDDLDRCSVGTIKLVLDAVRLVTSLPRVVTMVAVDDRIAYPAVESFFEQFKGSGRDASAVARDYFAKVFNVAISLPPVPAALAASFIKDRLFADVVGMGAGGGDDKPPAVDPEIPNGTRLVTDFEITEFTRLAFATGMSNPRALWRMKQAWYLLRNMALTFEPDSSFEPWMRSLFVREAILMLPAAARREVDAWAEAVQTGGALPVLSAAVPHALLRELSESESDVEKRWACTDIVLLPAAACGMPEPTQQPAGA
jgi:Cdc6-like AAA superfamily ATPase